MLLLKEMDWLAMEYQAWNNIPVHEYKTLYNQATVYLRHASCKGTRQDWSIPGKLNHYKYLADTCNDYFGTTVTKSYESLKGDGPLPGKDNFCTGKSSYWLLKASSSSHKCPSYLNTRHINLLIAICWLNPDLNIVF